MAQLKKDQYVLPNKSDVGLANVDNTSDLNKPISTATQTALNGKANTSHTHVASDTNSGTFDIARLPTGTSGTTVALGNHTHSIYEPTVTAGTTSQYYRGDKTFQTLNQDVVPDGTTNKAFTATEKTKLAGIATGATANDTDANLRARSSHTGTQTASTISDFTSAAQTAAPAETTTTVGTLINGATAKTTPVDADMVGLMDSAASNVLKKLSWANVKATLKTYFDTLYATVSHTHTKSQVTDFAHSITGTEHTFPGGTSTFLRADGTFATPAGGGGGTPGGTDTQIQFNDGGSFNGDADLTWNKTTNTLGLNGTDTGILLANITTEPSTPSAGTGRLYSKSVAGRTVPKWKAPSGVDYGLQSSLWQNNITQWTPSSATAGTWFGTISTTTSAGTFTVAVPSTTNTYTSITRGRYANVVTTTNQILGVRQSVNPTIFLGNTAGRGGFFFFCRFGFDVWTNGGRMFIGLTANTAGATVSADPSSNNNTIGFCIDAADNGAISFLARGTSATKTSTGYTVVSNRGYDVFMYAQPNSTTVNWRIIDLVAGTEASGSTSTNVPAVNTNMMVNAVAGNAALTTVTAIQLGLNKIYVETDY